LTLPLHIFIKSENGCLEIAQKKIYGKGLKTQAIKLRREIEFTKTAMDLRVDTNMIYEME